jgi:ankyrin repeat protein
LTKPAFKKWMTKFVHGYPGWFVPMMVERGEAKTEAQAVRLLSLIEAVENGDVKLVRKLVPSKFDPNLIFDEESLLERAVVHGQVDSVKVLVEKGADARKCGMLGGDVEIATMLLDYGANPNDRHGAEYTPLGGACLGGDEAMVALLIRAGADVNAVNSVHVTAKRRVTRCTPLMVAAWRVQVSIVQMLLSAGANARKKDSEGHTALDWACKRKGREAEKIAQMLEEAGR